MFHGVLASREKTKPEIHIKTAQKQHENHFQEFLGWISHFFIIAQTMKNYEIRFFIFLRNQQNWSS